MYNKKIYKRDVTCSWPLPSVTNCHTFSDPPQAWCTLWTAPWESVPHNWCSVGKGAVAELKVVTLLMPVHRFKTILFRAGLHLSRHADCMNVQRSIGLHVLPVHNDDRNLEISTASQEVSSVALKGEEGQLANLYFWHILLNLLIILVSNNEWQMSIK